ncbi:hypothetical protein [Vibrio phage JSF2]|uniref:Uncharacterized protein ORF125 n=2 Tax=root TaxID=1 RepID=F1D1E8_9CAUD|nr:hypothetical protein ViPhICP1_gp126 [Vibrio phage ICP1]ADX88171.1 hypothetical protein TUST1-191_00625 [Vibrio phage ICP1_2006_D]ADX89537.1 hypothetical protein TUST1-10_00625 [Vibrio phage ICP1_2004_A]ASV41821.1 hypothetical protein [Vibrio phage JSF1]ASV41962.1 hypothetical protein [Vibrio phage JSF2]ADX87942.1 conserved hypothetical protein [Vibrio phage ICP1]
MKKEFLAFLKCFGKVNEDKVIEDIQKSADAVKSDVEIKKSHDYKNQISVEIIAEPFTPDAHGMYYSDTTIEKGYQSFDKAWKEGRLSMNLFHQIDDVDKKYVELLKHYIVPFDCEVNGQKVKAGTWCAEVKFHDSTLWKARTTPLEDGTTEIAGLSIRGWGVVNDPRELVKAKVTKDDNGNLVYRGEKFVGYNKPMKDSGDKQGKVLVKDGDKIAVVRFGDPSMPDNQSEEANDNFYARFGNQKGIDDKFSPLYWSARWLWPRGEMKGKGAKEFFKLK